MKRSCLSPDCASARKRQPLHVIENNETKSEDSSSPDGNDLHERVERLREKTSRLSETLGRIEETLEDASRDAEN